jgi:hypothetical protein
VKLIMFEAVLVIQGSVSVLPYLVTRATRSAIGWIALVARCGKEIVSNFESLTNAL